MTIMEYIIVKFEIKGDKDLFETSCDLLCAMAGEVGFESFEETEEGVNGYIQKELYNPDDLNTIIDEWPIESTHITYNVGVIENVDWNETWENEGFSPIIINNKCVIYDVRHPSQTPDSYPIKVGIEAKMAFGTGTHETTQMIVGQLLGLDLGGKNVLDCGCGTGILGIVAGKLGAKRVCAYDIDEWSVKNTIHNAELNDVDKIIEVLHGDSRVLTQFTGSFDIVLANINRNILIADMGAFVDKLSTDGYLILSGFYHEDVAMLTQEAKQYGLELTRQECNNNWSCLVFKRTK